MAKNPVVTVLILTYKRSRFIHNVLDALRKQTYTDFEVLVVLKPSSDGTEEILESYKQHLNIRIVTQNTGYIVDAMNLGFKNALGRIVALVDDDAIPFPDWLENHMVCYEDPAIGGVAGNVLPINILNAKPSPVDGVFSEIIPQKFFKFDRISIKTWCSPIEKFGNYLVYISKAGLVEHNSGLSLIARRQIVNSLLGMGANMSFLLAAVGNFRFSNSWILGLSNEQFLAWHIHSKGYRLIFNQAAKVSHIRHSGSLSRTKRSGKKEVLHWTENNLLFYRLYGVEPGLSITMRLIWLIFDSFLNIKKFYSDRDFTQIRRLEGKFYSETIGIRMLISKRFGLKYSPLADLKKLLE